MTVTFIAAVASNGIIGTDNDLPWRLPAEMKYFTQNTLGKPVLMGRKTFESLLKPLRDRTNVILSRTLEEAPEGCELVRTVQEALVKYGHDELMVIGGAEIFNQMIDVADRMLITEIGQAFDGDAYFPHFDLKEWNLISRVPGTQDEKNTVPFTFCVYERVVSE
ncbi:dihydrofolate reductase [Cohnella silvisoli]|uniref:Dihydrofolate reductase n=1 Tax=Cohnella silvisoli TaxID=2873699 RepID=A0ABV1KQ54_9BACL|nr:dihydrofolate reductase [Cohnella silvisoli]MCD9020965.1 dihydrofolate reductase [Cohnella silvisoli]